MTKRRTNALRPQTSSGTGRSRNAEPSFGSNADRVAEVTGAATKGGKTTFAPWASGAPVLSEMVEHERIHAQQAELANAGQPVTNDRQALEDEAARGAAAGLAGRPFEVAHAAPPDMALAYTPGTSPASSGHSTYVVLRSDTLSGLAKRATGDAKRYTELKTLNNLESDELSPGDALLIPSDWDTERLRIHPPVDRPTATTAGAARVAAALSTGHGLAELQADIDDVAAVFSRNETMDANQTQFLSDFFYALYNGARVKASEPRQRLHYYFDAVKTGGADLHLKTGIWPLDDYTDVYADSIIFSRAKEKLVGMVSKRIQGGELEGALSTHDIVEGDPQPWGRSKQNELGQIRGKDWKPRDRLDATRRGHLMSEQDNEELKYTDNNFVLDVKWSAQATGDNQIQTQLVWSVRDLYLFRSGDELRDYGRQPEDFVTELPVLSGGTLTVPDHLLQAVEEIGWARRYHSFVEWDEQIVVSAQ